MDETDVTNAKKPKLSANTQSDISESARRKQVDSHVQAFLKAVLDRASNTNGVKRKVTACDACTQTEDSDELLEPDSQQIISPVSTFYHVPNREMYSQETLNHVSQQSIQCQLAQDEFSSHIPHLAEYYTALEAEISDTTELNGIQSVESKQLIHEWLEQYERWFYQNFGVNVRTAYHASQRDTESSISPACPPNVPSSVNANLIQTNGSETSLHSPAVVSHPPVHYIVPQGSICMPVNQSFAPYVSLLPPFYTANASQRPATTILPQPPLTNTFPNFLYSMTLPRVIPPINIQLLPPFSITSPIITPISIPSVQPVQMINTVPNPIANTTTSNGMDQAVGPNHSDLSAELRASALIAALSLPVSSGHQLYSSSQWGPSLRYGTYGRLPSSAELSNLSAQDTHVVGDCHNKFSSESTTSTAHTKSSPTTSEGKMPPPPPTFILLRRQAMICAVQLSCRDRARDLFLREKKNVSGIKIDYVSELEQAVLRSIDVDPVYVFTKLNKLAPSEREYFIPKDLQNLMVPEQQQQQHSEQPDLGNSFRTDEMYACDLLIGDVLVAEACATYKPQAQASVARQAFNLLSQPCFLVGSTRSWDCVDYLVLCLSPKADLVPRLPPFLADPFESLTSCNNPTDKDNSDENFEFVNPNPPEDFWLYIGHLGPTCFDGHPPFARILAQSAEFSQMFISFEVEVNMETGLFACSAVIDNYRYPTITRDSVAEAHQAAVEHLVLELRKTQPVVRLDKSCKNDPASLWGIPFSMLVDTLMWGKEVLDLAIGIDQLEAHCEVPNLHDSPLDARRSSNAESTESINQFSSRRHLDNHLQAYAASALVTPLHLPSSIVPDTMWPVVRQIAYNWGLLTRIQLSSGRDWKPPALLVCKRAPLPRLKRTIYEHGTYGCFVLFDKGNLSKEAIKSLYSADPLVFDETEEVEQNDSEAFPLNPRSPFEPSLIEDDSYRDEPMTQIARHFIATSANHNGIKSEPVAVEVPPIDDCVLLTAEFNQPSNAIEILDDLPRTLIPGIDF